MPDREEIISALEYLIREDCTDTQHDYVKEIVGAIALLKDQEPVKLKLEHGWPTTICICGACGAHWIPTPGGWQYNYCPTCGREIKWHD